MSGETLASVDDDDPPHATTKQKQASKERCSMRAASTVARARAMRPPRGCRKFSLSDAL
jgi:hypothetical protein